MIAKGEKGKTSSSLQSDAAAGLRYDPATKRASYIYAALTCIKGSQAITLIIM